MKRKVLVVGALGRIGSTISPSLFDAYDVRMVDYNSGTVGGRPVEVLDITDYAAVCAAMEGIDSVIHLAIASSRSIFGKSNAFEKDYGDEFRQYNDACINVNVRGTYNLYEAARVSGVKRFIYASSLTVLMGERGKKTHDDMAVKPLNFYAATKVWGEQLGELYSRLHGLQVLCLRLGTPHPQTENEKYEQWVNTPSGSRTFVTFGDLERVFSKALTAEGVPFGAYTVVSDEDGGIYDISKAKEIGWQAGDFVHQDGSISPVASK